jgi:LAO/AO transport system kinase
MRIGVTGPPGVGKSTFINQIGYYFLKKKHRVAVIAVDPSSAISKGSILGDKMRMHFLNNNKNAFVRPSPSKNKNSAIDFETLCSINLCELAEFDIVLIETVGSGQLEYNISKISDFLIYLNIANTGDEIQAMKKGIMEIADIIAINKSDILNKNEITAKKNNLKNILNIYERNTKIVATSSTQGTGIDTIYDSILDFFQINKNKILSNRKDQLIYWLEIELKINFGNKNYEKLLLNKNHLKFLNSFKVNPQIHKILEYISSF